MGIGCRRGNANEEEKTVAQATEEHRNAGEAIAVLCSSSSVDATIFRYSDAPRDEAKDAVDVFWNEDRPCACSLATPTASALAIAKEVDIEPTAVFSQLTPGQKLDYIESARENGKEMTGK